METERRLPMKYIDLIRTVKASAGAAEDESEDVLEIVVENVASHLTERTRQGFAERLPAELQEVAHPVPTIAGFDEDIIDQLMDVSDVDESRARRYIQAAWQALIELFDWQSVDDIRAELPPRMKVVLGTV